MPKLKKDFETEWLDGEVPLSTRHDDPYYSRSDGLAETRHVFIRGNDLLQRLSRARETVVGELGFGTGLNFLATWKAWQQSACDDASLIFHSLEAFPLNASEMDRALSAWPELDEERKALIEAWSLADAGSESFDFEPTRGVQLKVQFGEATNAIEQFPENIHAWFLDGFSPAKNPDMWSLELMQRVFAKTAANGTLATYTAAGWVRRNLIGARFEISKVPGHAGKREMVIGYKAGRPAANIA